VCVVTGSRAEFGLLRWVLQEIKCRDHLTLQLVVTGTHLAPAFGSTESEILNAGFNIDKRVEVVMSSNSSVGMAKSHALAVAGIAEALDELRPDVVVLLGDRYEIHATAVAALICRIPIAHIHGGEVTRGSIDEQFRHSITKMAQLHLVAHSDYRRRIIQMGEHPDTVHVVGGLGFESARRCPLMSRSEVEDRLGFGFQARNLLVVFHPETTSDDFGLAALSTLCEELSRLSDCGFIVSLPNADAGGVSLRERLSQFESSQSHAISVDSMGQHLYLSCLNVMDGLVGNSSSGLLEAPALGVPSLDVGIRQQGRLRLPSVLHSDAKSDALSTAIRQLLSDTHRAVSLDTRASLSQVATSSLICDVLERSIPKLEIRKEFRDLPLEVGAL